MTQNLQRMQFLSVSKEKLLNRKKNAHTTLLFHQNVKLTAFLIASTVRHVQLAQFS